MSERMTVKKFDSLTPKDFGNGAVLDEIRGTIKLCEELLHGDRYFDISKIRGAVSRGWCHPKTKYLEMDSELAEAISYEVLQLFLHGEGKEKTDPWEKWVERMPILTIIDTPHPNSCAHKWIASMKAWFRTMPRGK